MKKQSISKDFFIKYYINQKENIYKIGKRLNCNPATVYQYLLKYNIQIRHGNKTRFLTDNKDAIIDCFKNKELLKDISNKFDCSRELLARNLRKWGYDTTFNRDTIKNKKDYIITRFKEGLSAIQISREIDCDNEKLSNYLKKWGYLPEDNRIKNITNKNSALWKGYEEISGTKWRNIIESAKCRGLEFDITMKDAWDLYIKQDGKCALSGQKLTFAFSNKDQKYHNASLDRIDSSKGYIVDNCQWIDKKINIMKMNLPDSEFIEICKRVANFQKRKK